MKRTHHCNALRKDHVGQTVTLVGWVDTIRDLGGITFAHLRDREGHTQVVFDPQNPAYGALVPKLKPESVVEVTGEVRGRDADEVNPKLPTGEVEVVTREIVIHNLSETPPFPLEDEKAQRVNEDLRLQFRYLDLRRPSRHRCRRLCYRVHRLRCCIARWLCCFVRRRPW